jgi:hypothetical protein
MRKRIQVFISEEELNIIRSASGRVPVSRYFRDAAVRAAKDSINRRAPLKRLENRGSSSIDYSEASI